MREHKFCTEIETPQNREEWVDFRTILSSEGKVGGSDVCSLLGIYSSPYELMRKMTGELPPFKGNTKTEIGTFLEELVAEKTARMIGVEWEKAVTHPPNTFQSKRNPFMVANLDYVIGNYHFGPTDVSECFGIEVKTTSSFGTIRDLGTNGSDQCPMAYKVQCQHYMAVTGIDKFYIGVLVILDQNVLEKMLDNLKASVPSVAVLANVSHYYRWYEVHRDDAFIDRLVDLEHDFNQAFLNGTPPIDGSDITSQLLKDEYSVRTDEYIEPDPEDLVLLKEYWELMREIKRKELRAREIKNIWKSKIKDARGMSRVAKITSSDKEKFNEKQFSADHPELHSRYMEMSSYDRFNVTKI